MNIKGTFHILTLLFVFTLSYYTYNCGEDICSFDPTNGHLVINGMGKLRDVSCNVFKIKTVSIGTSVTGIDYNTFSGCIHLTEIDIPDSVTTIQSSAFESCLSLKTVKIGKGVQYLNYETFSETPVLESIVISDNNPYLSSQDGILFDKNKTILYRYPPGLSNPSYTIPESVSFIAEGAFLLCNSLPQIVIRDSVTTIGNSAFKSSTSLTTVNIPRYVATIGNDAFSLCTSLTSISVSDKNEKYSSVKGVLFNKNQSTLIQYPIGSTDTSYDIPNTVTIIVQNAFHKSKLESITIPNSVSTIGDSAFQLCTSLKSIVIPESVTSLGSSVFELCSSLESVSIPHSITQIKTATFSFCSSLTSITIPNTITVLNDYAFSNCKSLKTVIFEETPHVVDFYSEVFSHCSSLESFKVPNSVNYIYRDVFSYCTSLTSVEIPESVTTIESGVFTMTAIKTLNIPKSVTEIRKTVCIACGSLEAVNVDGENPNYSSVDGVLFNKKQSELFLYPAASPMTSYNVPDTVKYIDEGSFSLCKSLKTIYIPASVTGFEEYAFESCKTLEAINVDANNSEYSSIDGVLFDKQQTILIQYPSGSSNTVYNIPDTVTEIGENSFSFCQSLETVNIHENVFSILDGSFTLSSIKTFNVNDKNEKYSSKDGVLFNKEQNKLIQYPIGSTEVSYNIPDTVIELGVYCFSHSKLKTINIPNSVAVIDYGAFSFSTSLEIITIPNSVRELGENTFQYSQSLKSINIGDSVNTLYYGTFESCPNLMCVSYSGVNDISYSFDYIFEGTKIDSTNPIHVPNGYLGKTFVGYPIVKDNDICYLCNIENCQKCGQDNTCSKCVDGYITTKDRKICEMNGSLNNRIMAMLVILSILLIL